MPSRAIQMMLTLGLVVGFSACATPVAVVGDAPALTSVQAGMAITVGEEKDLLPFIRVVNTGAVPFVPLTWEVSNPALLSIDPVTGRARGLAAGSVVVQVRAGANQAGATQLVIDVVGEGSGVVKDVRVVPGSHHMAVGESVNLVAQVFMPDGQINGNVVWSSSDNTIATVNQSNGAVTALRAGRVTVVAAYALAPAYKGIADIIVYPTRAEIPASPIPVLPSFAPKIEATPRPATAGAGGGGASVVTPPPVQTGAGAVGDTGTSRQPTVTGKTLTVSGKVYDEEGALVDGAIVTIKSLNDAHAYNASATSVNGNYVFNSVPEGVQVAITATKNNWTARTRVEAFQVSAATRNEVNFGSPAGTSVVDAYFISRFPEIVSTTPAEDSTGVDATRLAYKLTLSEALDETNRRRFGDAIRLVPANAAAQANGAAPTDLEDSTNAAAPIPGGYQVRKDSLFLNDADTRATVAWNAAGTEATLAFNAPLAANGSDEAKYQLILVKAAAAERIEDTDGNDLGELSTDAGADKLILETFRQPSLPATVSSQANAWRETHDNVSTFEVAEDTTAPKLTGVAMSILTNSTRIELTFSEPMAAFNGTNAGYSDAVINNNTVPSQVQLDRFTFMVGEKVGDLRNAILNGVVDATVGSNGLMDATTSRLTRLDAKKEFAFRAGSGVKLMVDPKDAKRVFLTLPTSSTFDMQLSEIKARVEGITDPAGNNISGTDADKNLVYGSL